MFIRNPGLQSLYSTLCQRKVGTLHVPSEDSTAAVRYQAIYTGELLPAFMVPGPTAAAVQQPVPAPSDALVPCLTDCGVDNNMYSRYWADWAFECHGWGAFCSKVSPNVNVIAAIQVCTCMLHPSIVRVSCSSAAWWLSTASVMVQQQQ